jgi:type I restriction enzyme, S subunit
MKSPWPTKKLGEICEERKEKNINNENLPVFTVSHIYGLIPYQNIFYKQVHSKDTKNYKIVNRYDFAFGLPTKDTLPYGLLENEDKVLVSPAYIVFSIKNKNLLFPRFLYYILKTNYYKWKIIEMAKSQSATRHGLPLKFHHLANLEIPLPPLFIQQKIVKILDTIQSAVDIQERIIEKTKELKKSLMAELFKYGGPSFRKGRKLKKTEIGEIPEDWEVVRLGEVTSQIIDTPHKIPPKTSFGIPFISVNYMLNFPDTNFYIDKAKEGLEYVDLNEAREFLKRFIPEKNDILFSKWGTPGVAKLINTSEKFLGSCSLALIKPLTLKVNPFYLVYLLNSPIVRKQVDLLSPTSTRTEIHIGHIEKLKIPRPPLPEQQEIAEILQTIDQKIEIEKKKKELYEELFKTMLNKIMSQEIDVNLLDY